AFSPLGRAHVLLCTLRLSKRLWPFVREASGQDGTSLFKHPALLMEDHKFFYPDKPQKNFEFFNSLLGVLLKTGGTPGLFFPLPD
ncbi:MAG: hypothetical protein WBO24_06415, partial [Nitrospirales bacterium]